MKSSQFSKSLTALLFAATPLLAGCDALSPAVERSETCLSSDSHGGIETEGEYKVFVSRVGRTSFNLIDDNCPEDSESIGIRAKSDELLSKLEELVDNTGCMNQSLHRVKLRGTTLVSGPDMDHEISFEVAELEHIEKLSEREVLNAMNLNSELIDDHEEIKRFIYTC